MHDLTYVRAPRDGGRGHPGVRAAGARVPLARGAHVLTPIAHRRRGRARRTTTCPQDAVTVTPLGVDDAWFDAPPLRRRRGCRSAACPTQYLVFVGSLDPRKNLPRLLAAHDRATACRPVAPGPGARRPRRTRDRPGRGRTRRPPHGVALRRGPAARSSAGASGARAAVARRGLRPARARGCSPRACPCSPPTSPCCTRSPGRDTVFAPPTDVDALSGALAACWRRPGARPTRTTPAGPGPGSSRGSACAAATLARLRHGAGRDRRPRGRRRHRRHGHLRRGRAGAGVPRRSAAPGPRRRDDVRGRRRQRVPRRHRRARRRSSPGGPRCVAHAGQPGFAGGNNLALAGGHGRGTRCPAQQRRRRRSPTSSPPWCGPWTRRPATSPRWRRPCCWPQRFRAAAPGRRPGGRVVRARRVLGGGPRRARSGWSTRPATRCAPTASASTAAGSRTPRGTTPPRDVFGFSGAAAILRTRRCATSGSSTSASSCTTRTPTCRGGCAWRGTASSTAPRAVVSHVHAASSSRGQRRSSGSTTRATGSRCVTKNASRGGSRCGASCGSCVHDRVGGAASAAAVAAGPHPAARVRSYLGDAAPPARGAAPDRPRAPSSPGARSTPCSSAPVAGTGLVPRLTSGPGRSR